MTHIYEDDTEYEEHHYTDRDDDDEEEEEESKVTVTRDDNKIDKIMVWLGIGVAVVIVIITIAVVSRVLITFNGIGDKQQQTEEQSTSQGTVAANEGVAVPGLIGLTEQEAMNKLNDLKLGYKSVQEESDLVGKGYVMAQSVEEGVHVAEYTQIVVTVSTGPKSFEVTNVVNMKEEEAMKLLTDLNLNPVTEYEYSNDVEQGVVMKMVPVANAQVKPGDTITITVSRGRQTQQGTVPNLLGMDESQAREALDKAGLVAQLGGTASSSTVEAGKVVAQNYPEGTTLEAGTVVEYVLSSGTSNKIYQGKVVLVKAWATAAPVPEGFSEETGTKEVQVVFRQEKDGQSFSKDILSFTNIHMIMDNHEITFDGIVEGVSDGNAEVYVRYSWTDPVTGEPRLETKSVQTMYVPLSEAVTE